MFFIGKTDAAAVPPPTRIKINKGKLLEKVYFL